MFFADLYSVSGHAQREGARWQATNRHITVMKAHSEVFQMLPPKQLKGYQQAAQLRKTKSFDAIHEQKEVAVVALDKAKVKLEEARKARPPLTLTSCKLTDGQLDGLGKIWDHFSISAEGIKAAIDGFTAAPNVIGGPARARLAAHAESVHETALLSDPTRGRPGWPL